MQRPSYYETEQDNQLKNLISKSGYTDYPSHFHKKVEITYMQRGTCETIINGKQYSALQDDIIYVSSYHAHSYKTSFDAERITLCPTDKILDDFSSICDNRIFPCILSDKNFNKENILPLLNQLFNVHNDRTLIPKAKWLESKGIINVIYGNLYNCYYSQLEKQSKHIDTLVKILSYIDEHSNEKLTLDLLADQFGYSKFYFSKFFNASVGQSLNTYLNNIRIKNFIKAYPKEQNPNVTNLALELGFDSMMPFYRAFKTYCGCSPHEYFEKKND